MGQARVGASSWREQPFAHEIGLAASSVLRKADSLFKVLAASDAPAGPFLTHLHSEEHEYRAFRGELGAYFSAESLSGLKTARLRGDLRDIRVADG
jgi:hypothetical protein